MSGTTPGLVALSTIRKQSTEVKKNKAEDNVKKIKNNNNTEQGKYWEEERRE